MKLSRNPNSLEYWAQHQYLTNTDNTLNMTALQQIWPTKSRAMFQEQVIEAGYTTMPAPVMVEDVDNMTKEEFLEMYEFGTYVRSYVMLAAAKGKRLSRDTVFAWVSEMRPDKVEYGRDYHQVTA